MDSDKVVVELALDMVRQLPLFVIESVADAIANSPFAGLRAEVSKRVANHHQRNIVLAALAHWQKEAPAVASKSFVVALRTAVAAEHRHRDSHSVELVWTGPDPGEKPFRRTEQAILQVLDTAKTRITLVCYAVYHIPNVAKSLIEAAKRGVALKIVIETPNKIEGAGEYNTILALGNEVSHCSKVYYWPKETAQPATIKRLVSSM